MKIAVLTGGGDCPGLNAVIRAVVRRGEQHGLEVMGVREGWRGLMDPPLHDRLTRDATSGILHLGGTILGTSRTNPFKKPPGGSEMVLRNLKALNVSAVVAIGGAYGTLSEIGFALRLGVPVVGLGTWSLVRPDGTPDNAIIVADDPDQAVALALALAQTGPAD